MKDTCPDPVQFFALIFLIFCLFVVVGGGGGSSGGVIKVQSQFDIMTIFCVSG